MDEETGPPTACAPHCPPPRPAAARLMMLAMLVGAAAAAVAADGGPHGVDRADAHAHDHGHGHAHPPHVHRFAVRSMGHGHAVAAAHPRAAVATDRCACAGARRTHGWCPPCRVGYVAGVAVAAADLFEALDPHGHDVDVEKIDCATCRAASCDDGFCDACARGFVGGELYMTRLTYLLARGRVESPRGGCRACRPRDGSPTWCDGCRRGSAGNVTFDDPRLWRAAVAEVAMLRRAVERSRQCELCAVSIFTTAACPVHGPASAEEDPKEL